MLPSVLPTETDHVPVLADEVVAALSVRPGETVVDATFGAGGHASLLAARLEGEGKLIAIDRDPEVAQYFERFRRRTNAKTRLLHGEFSAVLERLGANGVRADAILLDLGVSSMQLDRPERRLLGARARQRGAGAGARGHLQALRRGALRAPGRARDRQAAAAAAVRAHGGARRGDQGSDSGAGAVRRRPPRQACLPGDPDRGERRARVTRTRAARRARDAAPRRPARGDLVPFARGPGRQALP